MKAVVVSLGLTLISSSAVAAVAIPGVPEIDGTLSLLIIALVGGLALLLKKR